MPKQPSPIQIPNQAIEESDELMCMTSWMMTMQQGLAPNSVMQIPIGMPCIKERCSAWLDEYGICSFKAMGLAAAKEVGLPANESLLAERGREAAADASE